MEQKTVLYIEDNYHNRRIVRKILQSRGYTVVEAEDGVSGLAMARELKPPVVHFAPPAAHPFRCGPPSPARPVARLRPRD